LVISLFSKTQYDKMTHVTMGVKGSKESQAWKMNERDHLEDLDINGSIILGWLIGR